jgi:hypothetical protein
MSREHVIGEVVRLERVEALDSGPVSEYGAGLRGNDARKQA